MSKLNDNPIIKRVYYYLDVELSSPLSVSNGENNETDKDILYRTKEDGNKEFFIPGTSVAGALRIKISDDYRNSIAGYSEGEKGKMSSLFVSDLNFETGDNKSVRDGIELDFDKKVKNKFDMEILETGAKGILKFSYVLRKNDEKIQFDSIVNSLINAIQDGTIRFGANKNRGFGRIKVNDIYTKTFTKENITEYIEFNPNDNTLYGEKLSFNEWKNKVGKFDVIDDYVKLSIPLKLNGGISIRKYSARPNEADYEHLTTNGKPVIPGTSWNGAIRHYALTILKELNITNANDVIKEWFGYIEGNKQLHDTKLVAKQSSIVIGESVIEDAVALTITRNKINRFDASTMDGALYTERSYFGGNTELEILVDKKSDYKTIVGLLGIIIKDIQEGFVAVGGQIAVGRGIFTENGAVKYSEGTENEYRAAFYQFAYKKGGVR